jgi:hypothetical protein
MSETEAYELVKPVWTQEDFKVMGWHDSKVWGVLANPGEWEYWVDLDYIFKWVRPEENENYFKFWVAPVTMVFENAYDIRLDIESPQGEIEVADLHMENPRKTKNDNSMEYTFRFECQEGDISLSATGYKLYVRKKPRLLQVWHLDFMQRGGVHFGRELTSW